MSDDLVARAHALFERIIDMDEESRATVLQIECAGQPGLRALVAELLAADQASHPLLDSDDSFLELLGGGTETSAAYSPGDSIGPYRLIKEAGRGGMATVYLAERDVGGATQRVALKLVKRGIDTDEVVSRFSHETRLLASLSHSNIARFFDAGVSPDGRPYLVMEFVEGTPVTEYADGHRLDAQARIDLFRTVCDAVQFAHQRLVVHRDIKPSNVLVTDAGEVKLLDFGIAKLLDEEQSWEAPLTRTGVRVLTPEYAAPEQIRGEPVSTATDVYGLGVVLYELLAGGRPERPGLHATDPTQIDTAALDPPSPSTAVRRATRDGRGGEIAAARATSPDRLRRRLSGDLDRIVLKALEHDPARRYQSAEQLGEDLIRHQTGRPVRARAPTLFYRLQKYVRRHRAVVGPAVTGMLLLGAFGGFYAVRITEERDRAQAEAEKAQTTTRFLQRLLGDAYPSVALGDAFSMDELLVRATARIDSLAGQPEIQAELLRTLGDIYREQGQFDEALELLERAVAMHRTSADPVGRPTILALNALGHLQYEARDFDAAYRTHVESLDLSQRLLADDDSLVLFAMNNAATAASALLNYDEALGLHREVLARSTRLFSDTSQLVHVTHNNLGDLNHRLRQMEEAELEFREAVRIRRIALPADHPSLALSLNNLGTTLEALGRLEEAETVHREAFEIFQRVFGQDHHRVGLSAYNLAKVLQTMGRLDEAERLLTTTLGIDRRTYGPRHYEVGMDLRRLGAVQRESGDCVSATPTLAEADGILAENGLPPDDRRRLSSRADLVACLTVLGRLDEAEPILLASLSAVEGSAAPDSVTVRATLEQAVELYRALGREAQADTFRTLLTRWSGGPDNSS